MTTINRDRLTGDPGCSFGAKELHAVGDVPRRPEPPHGDALHQRLSERGGHLKQPTHHEQRHLSPSLCTGSAGDGRLFSHGTPGTWEVTRPPSDRGRINRRTILPHAYFRLQGVSVAE